MALVSDERRKANLLLERANIAFPDPRTVDDDGLIGYGGDLSTLMLLSAYKQGIFPWYSQGEPILWWSPDPRLILYPHKFIVRKSFRRVLRSGKFTVAFDKDFEQIIAHCATVYREGQEATWITHEMIEAYTRLHHQGFAHCVGVYLEGKLVGGLYGLSIGGAFFGESMFSLVSDASKVAFKALSDVLGRRGYDFIDCQMKTEHMVRLGAEVVEREDFLDALEATILKPTQSGSWDTFHWEYKE